MYAHGLPAPENLRTAATLEASIREEGAVPATVGILGGAVVVGLTPEELGNLTRSPDVAKVSLRDVAPVLAGRRSQGLAEPTHATPNIPPHAPDTIALTHHVVKQHIGCAGRRR